MSQANSTRQKGLCAVGGFVVCVSAVAAVVASYDTLRPADSKESSTSLRGSSGRPSSFLPNTGPGSNSSVGGEAQLHGNSNVSSSSTSSADVINVIPQNVTSTADHFVVDPNSNDVAELISSIKAVMHHNNSVPSPAPSSPGNTSFPTYSPTSDVEFPTFSPTSFNDVPQKTLPIKRSMEGSFRLKLYWEEGYFWQEKTDERWWCMSCGENGVCEVDTKMQLRDCKVKDDNLDALFSVTSYGDAGDQFRLANTDLCLQKMGGSRAIKLKPCRKATRKNLSLQLFKGFNPDEKFDLRPSSYTDRCLSNHHHPKAKEVIYAETCEKAYRPDTGYWVAY
ncbi:hypothetical protein HJC23_012941 [Cyclotella cryptica]|uniref:Ricin B lectin domain-containing protein n=1 Tax=Cyclotella cryptica TaxID=29204 RepID=A0ABD3Q370_9STRA|eukprot:CCRYP_009296-RA/>CCRYP_009296-RA protein AED:0.00 eAED:-0.00 QI:0/-1/0/1/-1/1/1/0/335